MKRYTPPTFYSVDIETESIATWGSIRFDTDGTDSFDDTTDMEIDGGTDAFDSPAYRSILWGNK